MKFLDMVIGSKAFSEFSRKYSGMLIPIFLILGLSVPGAVGYIYIAEMAKFNAESVLVDSAHEQVALLRAKVDSQVSMLRFVASSIPEDEKLDSIHVSQMIESAAANSEFESISVVLPNGTVYGKNGYLNAITITSHHFKKAMQGADSVGCCAETSADGKTYIVAYQPIWGKSGIVRGILRGFYPTRKLSSSIISGAYNGQAYSYITDANGRIIVDTVHKDYIFSRKNTFAAGAGNILSLYKKSNIEDTSFAEIEANMKSGTESGFYFTYRDIERYTAFVPTGINNWMLFNTVNGSVIKEQISESVGLMFISLALLLFFAAVAVMYTVWRERLILSTLEAEKEELRLSRQEYKIAVDQSNKSIFRYDIKTESAKFSYSTSELFQANEEIENIAETLIEKGVVAPESAAEHRRFYASIQSGTMYESCEIKLCKPDGTYRWNRLNSTLVLNRLGVPMYSVISSTDITEHKEQEIAYERWRRSVSSLPKDKSLVVEYNMTDDICENICGELPLHLEDMPRKDFASITAYWVNRNVCREDANQFSLFMNYCRLISDFCGGKSEESLDFRINSPSPSGGSRWLNVSVQMVRCPGTECIKAVIVFRDIHEEKIEKLELEALSKQDPLTGVLNRKAFMDEAALLLRAEHGASHAFMMIDMDDFKSINDTLGHVAGDNAIIAVAKMFKSVLRVGDLVGRMGGDEFMIVLKNIPYGEVVERRAEIVRQMMRIQLTESKSISGSIGVALYPKDGQTFEELYMHADIALYRAKETGGDAYVFYD